MIRKTLFVSLTLWAFAALLPCTAAALSITFSTPADATEQSGMPVNASAAFVMNTATPNSILHITLSNLLTDPLTVAQNISGLFFKLSTGQNAATSFSSMGLERFVNADKTYFDASMVSTGWALQSVDGGFYLNLLAASTAPEHTIIGGPAGNNTYASANASITGNVPHNPFLAGPVTFDLGLAGVSGATTITSVFCSFGTTENNNVTLRAPEPGTLLMLGLGLMGLAGVRKFKK